MSDHSPAADARLERERRADDLARLDRLPRHAPDGASTAVLVVTHVGALPTGRKYYYVRFGKLAGALTEGAGVTITAVGQRFLAANLGTGNPPDGTAVVGHTEQGAWAFRY
jgi:hypothetical protein